MPAPVGRCPEWMNSHGAGSPPAGAPPHGWPGPPRRPGSGCLSWRWAAGSDRPSCPPKALQLAWEEQSCSTPALMSPRCPWCPPAPLASRGRECWGGGPALWGLPPAAPPAAAPPPCPPPASQTADAISSGLEGCRLWSHACGQVACTQRRVPGPYGVVSSLRTCTWGYRAPLPGFLFVSNSQIAGIYELWSLPKAWGPAPFSGGAHLSCSLRQLSSAATVAGSRPSGRKRSRAQWVAVAVSP